MKNKANQLMCMAKCAGCGMIVGAAVGAVVTCMLKSKKGCKCMKKAGLRDKAADAMETVGSVMQSIADMAR